MKTVGLIAAFILAFKPVPGQSNAIETDTLNRTNAEGKKEGYWIILGKHRDSSCYNPNQKIEEGFYINNRKNGLWKEYYCNGNYKNKITFRAGKAHREFDIYYENGSISESGIWAKNRAIHSVNFDENGRPIKEIRCDTLFNKNTYYHFNYRANGKIDTLITK